MQQLQLKWDTDKDTDTDKRDEKLGEEMEGRVKWSRDINKIWDSLQKSIIQAMGHAGVVLFPVKPSIFQKFQQEICA